MFIKEPGASALLLAIVFMSLGFLLAKATSPHGHGNHRGCQYAPTCTHGADEVDSENSQVDLETPIDIPTKPGKPLVV